MFSSFIDELSLKNMLNKVPFAMQVMQCPQTSYGENKVRLFLNMGKDFIDRTRI